MLSRWGKSSFRVIRWDGDIWWSWQQGERAKNVGYRERVSELQWLQVRDERLEKRWASVSHVWPIRRRVRYILCWRWDSWMMTRELVMVSLG